MSAHRDLDRLLQSFLVEGPMELPGPSYDEVRDRIEQKRQRAFIGSWRTPDVSNLLKIGLAAAAVVLIAVVGFQFLGNSTGSPGATETPQPTATPSTTPEPSASAAAGLPVGSSHVLVDPGVETPVRITVTIPAPGWVGDPGGSFLEKGRDGAAPPDGAGMIVFEGPLYVYGEPCKWSGTAPETPATTVDELVAALSAQALRDATAPVDITLDGYTGQRITLHVPDDAVFAECDGGTFGSWTVGADLEPYRYHQGPGQIDDLWILDVDGVLTVIDTAYYEGTIQPDLEELRAIVESVTFELP